MKLFQVIEDHYGPRTAESYDQIVKTLLWSYPEALRAGAAEVVFGRRRSDDEPFEVNRVLDLGAGTGNFSLELKNLLGFAPAHWTALDQSEAMLEAFSKKADFSFEKVISSLQQWEPKADENDVVISAFAVHHLDPEEKKELFSKVFRSLTPGGIFVLVDRFLQLPSEGESEEDYFRVIASGFAPAFTRDPFVVSAVKKEMVAQFDEDGDQPSSLSDHTRWMREVGFEEVRSPYQSFGVGMVSARKAKRVS